MEGFLKHWPVILALILFAVAWGAQQNQIANLEESMVEPSAIQTQEERIRNIEKAQVAPSEMQLKQTELGVQVARAEEQMRAIRDIAEENRATLRLVDQRLLLLLRGDK